MKHRAPRTGRNLPALVALAPALLFAVPGAAVADGEVDPTENTLGEVEVTNTETVRIYTDATGEVQEQRVYEQIALTGEGAVTIVNPVSTEDLRNLDGFGGSDLEGGNQVITTTVDGDEQLRSVSTYEGDAPLTVDVTYLLDGVEVEPGDVVGESGMLEVRYSVENTTTEQQDVRVPDGTGGTITQSADVAVPFVGSLTTTTPPNFTNVQSPEANMAGDGSGGTQLTFTMTLFPPIGAATADFGYKATITDGVIPDATITALPVNPLEAPTLADSADSYQAGVETGQELTAVAADIDADLLELRDGASTLAAGLIRLYEGADRLSAELNGISLAGADQLAEGAQQLVEGAGELADPSPGLDDGSDPVTNDDGSDPVVDDDASDQVADGAEQIADGVEQLTDSAERIEAGAEQVADRAVRIDAGTERLIQGLTQAGDAAPALLVDLRAIREGLRLVDSGLAQLGNQVVTGGARLREDVDRLQSRIATGVLPDIEQIRGVVTGRLQPGLAELDAGLDCQAVLLDYLISGNALAAGPCISDYPDGLPAIGALPGLDPLDPLGPLDPLDPLGPLDPVAVRAHVMRELAEVNGEIGPDPDALLAAIGGPGGLLAGLDALACDLDSSTGAGCAAPGLLQGVDELGDGVQELVGGVRTTVGSAGDTPGDQTLRGDLQGLQTGTEQAVDQHLSLIDRFLQLGVQAEGLSAGTDALADASDQLADSADALAGGTDQLADGADELADGADEITQGTPESPEVPGTPGTPETPGTPGVDDQALDQLTAGSIRVREGADSLEASLRAVTADASWMTAALKKAVGDAPAIAEEAEQLSEDATRELIAAGSQATMTFGEKYALIVAGSERAKTESMAFGAPVGADGATAYRFEISGEDGAGGRNWTRGLAALAVFAAGAAVLLVRRRSIL